MEPNKQPNNSQPNADLESEGIDVVGSGVSFDNEFTTGATDERVAENQPVAPTPETDPAPAPAAKPQPGPETPKAVPQAARQAFGTGAFGAAPLGSAAPFSSNASVERQIKDLRDDPSIKPLRTFKTDAEEAVRYSNVSKIDMVVAEQRKREASGTIDYIEPASSKGKYVALALIVMLAAAAGGWYYLSTQTKAAAPALPSALASIRTMVPYAKGAIAIVDRPEDALDGIERKLAAANAGLGNVYAVLPVAAATSTSQIPVTDVFSATRIPNRLLRSLGGNYMFGSYVYDVESPFIILTDTFYQNAYSGMLEWENNIASDLGGMIRQSYPAADLAALSNAAFSDMVISNVDVRALKDASGRTMLAYAFADKDTLVIATSESALKYLLDRLLQVRTIQ